MDFGAALCVGMLALVCGLHVPRTTVVVGLASPRGLLMASSDKDYIDLDHHIRLKRTMIVLPLECLKYLMRKASSGNEYVVLHESSSEMRAVYKDKIKVS